MWGLVTCCELRQLVNVPMSQRVRLALPAGSRLEYTCALHASCVLCHRVGAVLAGQHQARVDGQTFSLFRRDAAQAGQRGRGQRGGLSQVQLGHACLAGGWQVLDDAEAGPVLEAQADCSANAGPRYAPTATGRYQSVARSALSDRNHSEGDTDRAFTGRPIEEEATAWSVLGVRCQSGGRWSVSRSRP